MHTFAEAFTRAKQESAAAGGLAMTVFHEEHDDNGHDWPEGRGFGYCPDHAKKLLAPLAATVGRVQVDRGRVALTIYDADGSALLVLGHEVYESIAPQPSRRAFKLGRLSVRSIAEGGAR